MNWIEIIQIAIAIVVPLATFMGLIYSRLDKKFDKIDKQFEKVDKQFEKVDQRFDKIESKLESLDRRLTRLEGRFDERGYWESREWRKTGTEDKE